MAKHIPFISRTAVLDKYIHAKDPAADLEMASLILEIIQKDMDIGRYFFTNRPNPAWIPLLWDAGFFAKQPEPDVTEDGTFLAYWYAHEYLLAIASDMPDYLIRHINENLDLCSDWYKARAIVSLTQIKPNLVSSVIPKVLSWLKNQQVYKSSLAIEASNLLLFMAEKKYEDDAFNLFSVLITPILNPDVEKNTIAIFDAITLRDDFLLQKHVPQNNKIIDLLEKININKLISFLESSLRDALYKEAEITGEDIFKTSYWRNAIEDTEQDIHDSARDLLLKALRDSIDHHFAQLIQINQQPINNYLSDELAIFRRLGIFFLQKYPKEFQSFVVNELMNFDNLDKRDIHHEFFHLLKTGFPILNQKQQEELINAILSGPSAEKIKNIAQVTPYEKKNIKDYLDYWIKVRFLMIEKYLTSDAKQILDDLIQRTGKPNYPDYLSWSSGWEKINDISPLEDDELKAMTASDLYNYIQVWTPNSNNNHWSQRESWIGLAAKVAEIILISPIKYLSHLLLIAKCRPEFSQTIFGHLANDNFIIPEKDWSIWINLIQDLITINNLNNNEWVEVHRAIIRFLQQGLQNEKSTLPIKLLKRVRDIVLILVDSPDPNTEQDRPRDGWFSNLHPLTTALNHIRPMALETLVIYALSDAQKSKRNNDNDAKKIKWERVVKKTFTHKLDRMTDSSWSVHSIYGKYFVYFYWLDQEWAIKNIDLIFPQKDDERSICFFISAWDSFIFNSNYRPYLMPLLHQKYVQYIEYISKGYRTKSTLERLSNFAVHIVLEYCLADYSFDSQEGQNSLVVQFMNKLSPNIRANVAEACYLVFRDNREKIEYSEKFWSRIRTLWEWRNKEASIHNHSSEYDQEMKEFANLFFWIPDHETIQSLWPLLEGLLPHIASRKNSTYDWKALEKYFLEIFEKEPVKVMQFYKMMYDQLPKRPIWLSYHSNEEKALMKKANASKDFKVKEILFDLIDNQKKLGDSEFETYLY